jgi:cyclopropane fatty-acyl-phospholipid synthase-like methyltransferase
MQKEFWNERYAAEAYAYGTAPNEFLKHTIDGFITGSILFPAEGEGRNAVYAASKGWNVFAFDQSVEGKKKADALAEQNGVRMDYVVPEKEWPYNKEQFDVIALIYAHFPADQKSQIHHRLLELVKPGGKIVFEAFSKKHLDYVLKNPAVGGPRDIGMLFSKEEIQNDFSDCEFLMLEETEVELHEGQYHNGVGHVVRCIAQKKF